MVLNKDKVRQSIFDVVPRAAREAKAREDQERRRVAPPDGPPDPDPSPTEPPAPVAPADGSFEPSIPEPPAEGVVGPQETTPAIPTPSISIVTEPEPARVDDVTVMLAQGTAGPPVDGVGAPESALAFSPSVGIGASDVTSELTTASSALDPGPVDLALVPVETPIEPMRVVTLPDREATATLAAPAQAPQPSMDQQVPILAGVVSERAPIQESAFLEADPAHSAFVETPHGFSHVIRRYLTADFFSQFIRLFIVCKMCQHRLESSGQFLSCPGCKHKIDSRDLAVHVMRYVGEELYARERVTREMKWLYEPKTNLHATTKKRLADDASRVLLEAYVCIFAHELVKTVVLKSPDTLLEFFRKYIDRIEIGKGDIKILIR